MRGFNAEGLDAGTKMKRPFLLLMLLFLSQAAAYSAQNSKDEQELRKLDERRTAAILKRDIPMLEQLMTDDFTYTHSSGNVQTKAEFLGDMKSGAWRYMSLNLSGVKMKIFENTAVLTGRCDMTGVMGGKDIKLAMHFTEVYVRTGGQWHWLVWQSTRLPDQPSIVPVR
jgi:ketosteroid isomerase-like protein